MPEGNTWSATIASDRVKRVVSLLTARDWNGTRSLLISEEGLQVVQANKDILTQLKVGKSEFKEYSYGLSENSIHIEISFDKVIDILQSANDGKEEITFTVTPPETELVIEAQHTDFKGHKVSMSLPFNSMTYMYEIPEHDYDLEFTIPNFESFLRRVSIFNSKLDLACKKTKIIAYCNQGTNSLCIAEFGESEPNVEVSSRRYDVNLLKSVIKKVDDVGISIPTDATVKISNTLPLSIHVGHIHALVGADGSSPGAAVPKSFSSYKKKAKRTEDSITELLSSHIMCKAKEMKSSAGF